MLGIEAAEAVLISWGALIGAIVAALVTHFAGNYRLEGQIRQLRSTMGTVTRKYQQVTTNLDESTKMTGNPLIDGLLGSIMSKPQIQKMFIQAIAGKLKEGKEEGGGPGPW